MTKGNTTGRGYGHTHQQRRKQWARQVAAGGVKCWRCHELIEPGDPWDLGHDDYDRSLYRGPEHRACDRGTAGRKGIAIVNANRFMTVNEW